MWLLGINFQKDFILFGYSQIHEIYPQLEYMEKKETNIFKKTSHLQMNLEVKSFLNTRKYKEKGMQKN